MKCEHESLDDILRKPVYALNNGTRLGWIRGVYLNQEFTCVAAIEVQDRPWRRPRYVLAKSICIIGKDVAIIDCETSRMTKKQDPLKNMIDWRTVRRAPIIIAGRVKIGALTDVYVARDKSIVGWAGKIAVECNLKSNAFLRRDIIDACAISEGLSKPEILVDLEKQSLT
jgi:uncharacterized protein YrrD